MSVNFKNKTKYLFVLFIVIIFSLNILKIGVISDYNYIYNFKSFIQNYDLNFFKFVENFIKNGHRYSLILYIHEYFLGSISGVFFLKFTGFIYFLFFTLFFFVFIKKNFNKEFGILAVLLLFIFFQFTQYLDPFIAWPEINIFSLILIIFYLHLLNKIFHDQKVNIFLYTSLTFFLYFYYEYTAIINFLFIFICINKIYNKKFFLIKIYTINFIIVSFLYFFFVVKIFYNNTVYEGVVLNFRFFETTVVIINHLLRTIPLTWLFHSDVFKNFYIYFFNQLSFFYVLLFFIYFFCISSTFKFFINYENKKTSSNFFLYLVSFYLITSPSILISLSKGYQLQLYAHKFGVAHYIVIYQYIGAILLIICLLSRFNKFLRNNLLRNFISIFLSFIFLINYSLANYTASRLEPHRNLYPYLILENFLRKNEVKNIQTVIILEKENYGFWTHKEFFQTNLSRKIKNTFTDFWLAEKDKRLKDVAIDEGDNYLIIKKLDFSNPRKLILEGCIDKLENKFDKWQDCKGNFIYEEQRSLIYYIKSRKLEFLKS